MVFPDHKKELSNNRKLIKEEGATCGLGQSSGIKSISEPQQSVLETNEEELLRLNPETPKRESPAQEEEESSAAASVQDEDLQQLLQELTAEREEAHQLNKQLQLRLVEYFHNEPIDGGRLQRGRPEEEQLQEYEKNIQILCELKLQLSTASQAAQQEAEELRLQSQEKVDKVEEEWEAFMALKQDVAVKTLSRRLGKDLSLSKVRSVLQRERLRENELTKLRRKHFKLRSRICRLEAELHEGRERGEDSLQIQFEQLQAKMLEQRKQAEKEWEESLKLQKKIASCLEVLSNIKEKLYWSQMEVQAKREQQAEVEAMVAEKRVLLIQTKQARNHLQRDNQRLKERRGLLGNRELLWDFEQTLDTSERLEKQLESLKSEQAEITFKCGKAHTQARRTFKK
ncbi:coiled-coil domain-containing protein 96 [Cyprinodon tularosa]|uniref:coiled-coil domain-containing protein 96 n=1 Tax=Cyprinodon tularosa TaxID=77115 RepID=UPI0018E1E66F|nr:coiled-coil domain-containing protein 96 [Cyprinodon tularosa]